MKWGQILRLLGMILCLVEVNLVSSSSQLLSRIQRLEGFFEKLFVPSHSTHQQPSRSPQEAPPLRWQDHAYHLQSCIPNMDMFETDDAIYVFLELPGVPKEKLLIQEFLDLHQLRISGEIDRNYEDLIMQGDKRLDTTSFSPTVTSSMTSAFSFPSDTFFLGHRYRHLHHQQHAQERRMEGMFYRSITLPEGAVVGQVKTKYRDGVLEMVIPKVKSTSMIHIPVN